MKIFRLVLLISIIAIGIFLFIDPMPFKNGLFLALGILTLLWGVSLAIKDSSIIDSFWGPGFAILAWYYFFISPGPGSFRNVLLCIMVSVWGLRLGLYILTRNWGKGEDYRYQKWRKEGGKNYWWISFLRVFMLQGILMWIISTVLYKSMSDARVFALTSIDFIGIGLWTIGLLFESIGDFQLRNFKKDPANAGKVMDQGLWKYTRHPNYFGDALLWWGYFMFALNVEGGYWFIFCPLLMTILLMRISGVSLLEETLIKTKPKYEDYIRRTSAFIPWFPKK